MARLYNHRIIETWSKSGSNVRYHITSEGRALRTTGPRMGNAKVVRDIHGRYIKVDEDYREGLRQTGFTMTSKTED